MGVSFKEQMHMPAGRVANLAAARAERTQRNERIEFTFDTQPLEQAETDASGVPEVPLMLVDITS